MHRCCENDRFGLCKTLNQAYIQEAHLSSGVSHFRPDGVPRRRAVVIQGPGAPQPTVSLDPASG